MGGTFREMGIGANSADGNPAQLALVQAYQLEFAGGWDARSNDWYLAGWARDSTNPDISGAYSFHYITNDIGGGQHLAQYDHSLSLATRLGDIVAIGIGGRWFIQGAPRSINAASLNVGHRHPGGEEADHRLRRVQPHRHPPSGAVPRLRVWLQLAHRSGAPGVGGPQRSRAWAAPADRQRRSGVLPRPDLRPPRRLGVAGARRATNYGSLGLGFVVDNAGFDVGYRHGLSGAGDLVVGTFRLQLQ